MFLDILARLATAQAITTDAPTDFSYDCGNPTVKNRIGTGEKLSLIFAIKTAARGDNNTGADQYDFSAIQDTVAGMSTYETIITRRVPQAELVAGAVVEVPLPAGRPSKRYLAGRIDVANDDTMTFDCYVVKSDMVQAYLAYAKGYTV